MPDSVDYNDEIQSTAAALGISLPTIPSTGTTLPADALKSQEGTQVPDNTNASPERYQTWPERMVRGAISAMALPGDVLSGKVQPGSTQEIERAMDLAGLMVMGPAPVASKLADGTLGSFAGVTSKTLDKNKLAQAQVMQANGANPEEIWQTTGFFRGADTRWRYEILDQLARLKMNNFVDVTPKESMDWSSVNTNTTSLIRPKNPLNDVDMSGMSTLQQIEHLTSSETHQLLSDIIDHPELFKAYPFLKDVKVQNMPPQMSNRTLAYVDSNGDINLSPMSPDLTKQVLLHEIQHIIQRREGFARGGNPSQFEHPNIDKAQKLYDDAIAQGGDPNSPALTKAKKIIDDNRNQAYKEYHRLAGEVEARNVENRLLLDEELQRRIHPNRTEEYSSNQQLVKF